ncbi:THUMP domain-containing class I SAM-dependent RNA methyltransferase [Pseudodesulfovibrio tunisiensis]|uniref:THUMP domain-containing class I SAM-dependent RNA methyltransferase n=1 Tax=Pseudodesulfovibrio tunisiensis TaxID=463192 RepID=UPI001FB5174A|nr:class I SAM-dependent RNA methyltransferase [Pseudodesulfovibrio tunisiensis]
MSLFDKKGPILVTCPKAMPPYLQAELEALGMPHPEPLDAGVLTKGTLMDCMRLNLHVRTGHRVLFELASFQAFGPDDLHREVRAYPWETVMDPDGYFSVSASIRDTEVNDSRFAGLRVKDGVADRFMEKFDRRPDSGPDQARGVNLFLHWRGARATLYLDTSGEPLPRRGYRKRPHTAPMQETLAAACILASTWPEIARTGGHFIAPMCGSGTLVIEAALLAMNGAPGLLREHFSFMHLKGYNPKRFQHLVDQAEDGETPDIPGRIIATDIDPAAMEAARANAEAAGVAHCIEFRTCDFRETEIPDGPGVIMLNPEYGERLGDERELVDTYKAIGDFFKSHCQGKTGYIFTGNLKLAKRVGLRTSRRLPFWNAKIECRLLEYELYAGSRKAGKE